MASRKDVQSGLKDMAGRRGGRMSAFLAAAQIALSVVLLTGAGLLIRTFFVLSETDPGFDARDVLTANVALAPLEIYGPDRRLDFFSRLLAGVERLPGVKYAAITSSPPMATFNMVGTGLRAEGGRESDETVSMTSASADYFRALGIRLEAGRFFDSRDSRDSAPVAIINQALAGVLFGDRDPVGRRIVYDKDSAATVVGVVRDIRHRALDDKIWPELYRPFEQSPSPWMTLVLRGAGDPSAMTAMLRRVVQGIDSSQPLFDVETLESRVAKSLEVRRERATVLGAFAALALLIAAVGVYSVMSYTVARRTHEIGVRMALGAARGDVARMVAGAGLRTAALGITVGIAGALALTRTLKSFLYGIEPADAVTFCAVCAILAVAAAASSYVPARRAASVDRVVALRQE